MKKLKRVTSGLVAGSLALLPLTIPQCKRSPDMPVENPDFDPSENVPVDVYGPPESFDNEDPVDEFDPTDNIPVAVYGPPEWFSNNETAAMGMGMAPAEAPAPQGTDAEASNA